MSHIFGMLFQKQLLCGQKLCLGYPFFKVSSEDVKKYQRCSFNIKNALIIDSIRIKMKTRISLVLILTLRKDFMVKKRACSMKNKSSSGKEEGHPTHSFIAG